MAKMDDLQGFDWLPGFKEMMACQEEIQNNTNRTDRRNNGEMENLQEWMNNGEMESPQDRRNNGEMENPQDRRNNGEMENSQDRMVNGEMQNDQGLLPPEQLQKEEQANWKDFEYLIGLLPAFIREIWVVADAILDRYEFEGSSIYAEYPDKESILRIADLVYDKLKYREANQTQYNSDGEEVENYYYMPEEKRNGNTPFRQLILLVLLSNMAYRRQRYFRRNRLFRP